MTQEWNKCRKAAIACNKLEDSTVKYVATCKTGANSLKTKLKALYKAKVSQHHAHIIKASESQSHKHYNLLPLAGADILSVLVY